MRLSRQARMLLAIGAALGLVVGLAAPAALAADVSFGTPSATATFGTGVMFVQPVNVSGTVARAELLITFPTALGPLVHQVPVPSGGGALTLRGGWSDATDGHLVPNTPLVARWRITPTAGAPVEGPPVTVLYEDTRFSWQTITGPLVRIHWYQGTEALARRALAVGEKGVQQAADLLGVTETQPIDFYVYASQTPFYDALGPGTRENVGGEAHADIRTMFALIEPSAVNDPWVGVVIPHELTHLVFNTAVENPYHFPPRWLNEGLAVYLSEGYTASWRSAVEGPVSGGTLLSLAALDGQFPTTADGFLLAYGESVSAVDYFVRTYGKARLASLIRSYAAGRTDDEAFSAAIGLDVPGFEAAWLADLGATAPHRYGPQPAPAGPLPPGWSGPALSAPSGAGSTAPASGSVNVSSASPGGAAAPAVPNAGSSAGDGASAGLILVAIAVAGLCVGGILGYLRRRRILRAASTRAAGPPGQDPPDPGPPAAMP
jgi:hypothetical protein